MEGRTASFGLPADAVEALDTHRGSERERHFERVRPFAVVLVVENELFRRTLNAKREVGPQHSLVRWRKSWHQESFELKLETRLTVGNVLQDVR